MNPKRFGSWFKQQKTNRCAVKTVPWTKTDEKCKTRAKKILQTKISLESND